MISGFAHEYCGFIELTADELRHHNENRRERGLAPMKYTHFCIKKFDYGVKRDGYWTTDDMIEHAEEVIDGLDTKYAWQREISIPFSF